MSENLMTDFLSQTMNIDGGKDKLNENQSSSRKQEWLSAWEESLQLEKDDNGNDTNKAEASENLKSELKSNNNVQSDQTLKTPSTVTIEGNLASGGEMLAANFLNVNSQMAGLQTPETVKQTTSNANLSQLNNVSTKQASSASRFGAGVEGYTQQISSLQKEFGTQFSKYNFHITKNGKDNTVWVRDFNNDLGEELQLIISDLRQLLKEQGENLTRLMVNGNEIDITEL